MKSFLHRLTKFLAYSAAGVVILLAIAVGLFRLFLPRLPEYQEEIKAWASTAIGMRVEFSGMDARWGLSGPELEFYEAELIRPDSEARLIAAEEVRIGVSLGRFLVDRTLDVDRVVIRETSIDVQQLEDGRFRVQGSLISELLKLRPAGQSRQVSVEVIGEDLQLRFARIGDQRPTFFAIPNARLSANEKRVTMDAEIGLPETLGQEFSFSATQLLAMPEAQRSWDVAVEADDLSLAGLSDLLQVERRFASGRGDLDLDLAFADGKVMSAVAELDFANVALSADNTTESEPVGLGGRVEMAVTDDGWLVAVDDLRVALPDHSWPETSLRVEAGTNDDGQVVMMDVQAPYLNLDDLSVIDPWLSDAQRQKLTQYAPSGIVRDLTASLSELDTDEAPFNVSAKLLRVGFADSPGLPGVRGFSGLMRADRSGGRLEIDSTDLQIDAPEYIDESLTIDIAEGTVIWRTSTNRTTVLSDSIRIDSDFFTSQSSVQLTFPGDGGGTEVDLASRWAIADVAVAKRYIPRKAVNAKLFDWFQTALVAGSIPRGTAELVGPLDKFPFDGGEGRMLINAAARNITLKYHRDWPAAEQANIDVVVDNARLYTESNRSTNAGNTVVDAKVDIPDLRNPILQIDSLSSGPLESVRQFSLQSPIAKVFGGQLDRVSVSGDASFTLDLTVPLKRLTEFEFVSRIRSENGSLTVDGFGPAVTELNGEVTLERQAISSDALKGRFLGQPVNLSLARSDDAQFSVVASADGVVTADGVVNELGVPVEGLVGGAALYQARILFPNSNVESPAPLTIEIESDFKGFAFDLPQPVAKAADDTVKVVADIRFMPGGERIESVGTAEDRAAWQLAFTRAEDAWDLDRGVVSLGGAVITEVADTRGLHLRGTPDVVRLEDWLSLSRRGEKSAGAATRVRSIDIVVDDLYIVGQHLQGHRVRVDRSARDWLVQLDGADAVGSVFVPYDFGGDRAMVLEMQKLRLPGGDLADESSTNFDPRTLPPITLRADEFSLGDRYLGAVEATLEKVPRGLVATTLQSKDGSFEIAGRGRWLADDEDPLGSHTYVAATLTSTDVRQTMMRLDYQPGIASKELWIRFDLDWSGGPRAEFFDVLDGEVEVRLAKGQLEQVEPGAGRVFGLMSIVALPRRLSLDFRDVFSKGFAFDKIAGTFRIADGKTYTCDLSFEGPAADIGIVGEADLNSRTYDQTAIVSANVGNTLPIVGMVVAGPQVAAGLLIFSQIFKKPLQEVGQNYYSISGSWDEAEVDSSDSAAFVRASELARCLAAAE